MLDDLPRVIALKSATEIDDEIAPENTAAPAHPVQPHSVQLATRRRNRRGRSAATNRARQPDAKRNRGTATNGRTVYEDDPLHYGFDLSEEERGRVTFQEAKINKGGVGRSRWTAEQTAYLHHLLELGLRLMNRPLERYDFPAITEALHRRFLGTANYPIRGYNGVHSYVFKTGLRKYEALERRILRT